MHAIACIRQVPDYEAPAELFTVEGSPPAIVAAREVKAVIGLFDHHALEAALRPDVQGTSVTGVRVEQAMDMRYVGQSFEITVPVDGGDGLDRPGILLRFHALHEEAYGFSDAEEPVELVNVRVTVLGLTAKPRLGGARAAAPPLPPPRGGRARIPDFATGQTVACEVLDRGALQPGHRVAGPLLIMDPSSSILVPPGWAGGIDGGGNILLSRS